MIVLLEGLGDILGMVYCFGFCCGDKLFIVCCVEVVVCLDLCIVLKKDVMFVVWGNMFL